MRRMKYQGNDKASGSRTHDKEESQVLCYNCRKPGHYKSECPYPIVKKHQDEHNYKKNSGRYHHPKNNPNDADEESSKIQKNDKRRKALAVEEKTGEKNEESSTSSSSSESDSSEDEKGLLCLFSQEDSDEEMCFMAEEEEVTSQDQSSNYSSESVCHENPRETFEKMMKSFYGIEDSHLKLKEENAKLLAERQDLEDLKLLLLRLLTQRAEKRKPPSSTAAAGRTELSTPSKLSAETLRYPLLLRKGKDDGKVHAAEALRYRRTHRSPPSPLLYSVRRKTEKAGGAGDLHGRCSRLSLPSARENEKSPTESLPCRRRPLIALTTSTSPGGHHQRLVRRGNRGCLA
nr:uncharacterized protein LOC109169386 [Ipomoea trifida]